MNGVLEGNPQPAYLNTNQKFDNTKEHEPRRWRIHFCQTLSPKPIAASFLPSTPFDLRVGFFEGHLAELTYHLLHIKTNAQTAPSLQLKHRHRPHANPCTMKQPRLHPSPPNGHLITWGNPTTHPIPSTNSQAVFRALVVS